MPIHIATNFQLSGAQALDTRIVVADAAARVALVTGNVAYPGIVVFQLDDESNWQLGADGTTWIEFGAGGGAGETIVWQKTGDLFTFTSTQKYVSVGDKVVDYVLAVITDTPPSGDVVVVDMLLDGTDSLWSNPTDRPTIETEGTISSMTPPDLPDIPNLHYVVPVIANVGTSPTVGTGLIIYMRVH